MEGSQKQIWKMIRCFFRSALDLAAQGSAQ